MFVWIVYNIYKDIMSQEKTLQAYFQFIMFILGFY